MAYLAFFIINFKEKGLKLVAEFVCDENVYNKVKELGIDFAQGYYLQEPQEID